MSVARAVCAVSVAVAAWACAGVASAHPHVCIAQTLRFVEKDGFFTHVETEWRFDPFTSEPQIRIFDADRDGKLSAKEAKELADDALPSLRDHKYFVLLNTGREDFRPSRRPGFEASVLDPAAYVPGTWQPSPDGTAPDNRFETVCAPGPAAVAPGSGEARPRKFRNLVYFVRHALPAPAKTVSAAVVDAEDFVRFGADPARPFEVVGGSGRAVCTLDKHPTEKAEYWPGVVFHADRVTCRLP